jgi:hypothetical protein
MATMSRSFDNADEVRRPANAQVDIVQLGDAKVARFTLQPGWRWSLSVKPIVGTETCQASHTGAVVAGRMHVQHADGNTITIGPGDAYHIDPGHDAWIEGDDVFVGYEFDSTTAATYATGS